MGKAPHMVLSVLVKQLAVLALAGVPVVWSQAPDAAPPGPPGTWHAAVAFRRAPRDTMPDPAVLLERVRAELAAQAPERARDLLLAHPVARPSPLWGLAAHLRGLADEALGEHASAGRFFAAGARSAEGPRRGALEARAGQAFDRAGLKREAVEYYGRAARRLPEVAGWLAVRRAQLTHDTARAARLVHHAGPAAAPFAARARAHALVLSGDMLAAERTLVQGGLAAEAATVALARGDAARARRLAYAAMASPDPIPGAQHVGRILAREIPDNADALAAAGQFFLRTGGARDAVALLRGAVASGHGSARVLLLLGRALEESGAPRDALAVYTRAESLGGDGGARAAYARARMVLRLRGAGAGADALVALAARYRGHAAAPEALLLAADTRERASRPRTAEPLYQEIIERWPSHAAARQARMRLASRAFERRDFTRAAALFREVAKGSGTEVVAARYHLGRVLHRSRDTAAARAEWTAVATRDALGYYGLLARMALGLPDPVFAPVTPTAATPGIREALTELNLLDALGYQPEAEALVRSLVAQPYGSEQLLELAEALLRGRRTAHAVSLGWRAAGELTLNDPRVLRVVFPWPLRDQIEAEARKFNIDPYLLAGLIRQESTFRPAVVSRAGATGLMQLMPRTAAQIARGLRVDWSERLLTVPDANLHLGAAHLATLLRRYRGGEVWALAAYNAGGRPVDRWRRLAGGGDPFLFVERIPYPETRGYVQTVVRNRALYRALYPSVSAQ